MENPYKKSFTFEDEFYSAVEKFIEDDIIKNGYLNFDSNYQETYKNYREWFNNHFCGKKYKLTLTETTPGSDQWKRSADCDVNFGQIWESVGVKFMQGRSDSFKAWPNGIMKFPDFSEGILPGDFKTALSSCYADNPANSKKGLSGYLKPGGSADLYEYETYRQDISLYKKYGKLSEHLKALIVFRIYEYRYEENTGIKYAIVHNIIVAPALFCVNFNLDGTFGTRNDKVVIGIHERNYKNIMEKNFGF